MCIGVKYSEIRQNKFIAKKTFPLTAYKIIHELEPCDEMKVESVGKVGKGVFNTTHHHYYNKGVNKDINPRYPVITMFHETDSRYKSGFHCFLTLAAAQKKLEELSWRGRLEIKKVIITKPEHITTIGTENRRVVLVVNEFTFVEEK